MRARGVLLAALAAAAACGGGGGDDAPEPSTGETYVISDVAVFDGEKLLGRRSVVVADGTITEIGESVDAPDGSTAIDGTGQTLLPGLIDAHVHLRDVARNEQAAAYGVTTMLDMLSTPPMIERLRDDVGVHPNAADFRSAINAATSPGGHGTEYGFDPPTLSAPEEAEAFVRARVDEGSDYLKIIMEPSMPTLTDETVAALVEAAHRHDLITVVHVSYARDAKAAIEAGADGLAHVWWDDAAPAVADVVADHDAFVVATLTVHASVAGDEPGAALLDDERILDRITGTGRSELLATFPRTRPAMRGIGAEAVGLLHDAGVDVLAGTDAPNPGTTFGASLHQELELLVDAGLSTAEALAAATSLPARRFDLDDRGRIAEGLRADLLLVDGDPLADITSTRSIVDVWVGGHRLPHR